MGGQIDDRRRFYGSRLSRQPARRVGLPKVHKECTDEAAKPGADLRLALPVAAAIGLTFPPCCGECRAARLRRQRDALREIETLVDGYTSGPAARNDRDTIDIRRQRGGMHPRNGNARDTKLRFHILLEDSQRDRVTAAFGNIRGRPYRKRFRSPAGGMNLLPKRSMNGKKR